MKKKVFLLTYFGFGSFLISCVFLICGCSHNLAIQSTPQDADVYYDGEYKGKTPLTLHILEVPETVGTHTLAIRKDGHKTFSTTFHDYFGPNNNTYKNVHAELEPLETKSHSAKEIKQGSSISASQEFNSHEHIGKWAIIIGISKYKYSGKYGLTNLIFADDDARAFESVLRSLGWSESHIKILINEEATERNIKISLESWLSKAGINDHVVLFWAGHGFPDPEDPEKVYFSCYDTDISIPATGYRMDNVRRSLEEKKAKNVVVFADTCHAGKLVTRGERGISIIPKIMKMNRQENIPKGWIFMVSAETDRQAIEHTSWANGAFTHCLIKGLSGEADGYQSIGPMDGVVTMSELRAYLNTAMPDETQRVLGVAKRPVITTSTGDPDIWNLTLHAK